MHFSFLISFNNLSCKCFEQIDHHQQAVTVHAACGIYCASTFSGC